MDIAAARRELSNSNARELAAGSTSTKSAPAAVLLRYQKRFPSSSQLARTWSPEMSWLVCQGRSRSARVYVIWPGSVRGIVRTLRARQATVQRLGRRED